MERRQDRIVIGWVRPVCLFLFVVLMASASLYPYMLYTTPELYAGRVEVTPRASAEAIKQTDPETMANDAVVIATSEKVLQGTVRTLVMDNVTLDSGALIQTAKVRWVPGTRILSLELTSPDRKEAAAAIVILAREAQRVYFETINAPHTKEGDKNASRLEVVKGPKVFLAPNEAMVRTARLVVYFALALLVIFLGVGVGRRAIMQMDRQGNSKKARWVRPAIVVLIACVAASVALYLYLSPIMPKRYLGRSILMERISPKSRGVGPETSIVNLRKDAMSEDSLRRTCNMLAKLNVEMAPNSLRQAATIERLPDSNFLKVEVTSTDRDKAEAATDVLAAEVETIYSRMMPGSKVGSANASKLETLDEAHIYPASTGDYSRMRLRSSLYPLRPAPSGRQ
jgi:hypothetical protein